MRGGVWVKTTNTIQINKQSTIVQVGNRSCRSKKGCKKPARRVKKISGRIFQLCNGVSKIYFRSVDARLSALIQVENKSSCVMHAIVQLNRRRIIRETIELEQQVSIYVPSIKSLRIQCTGDGNGFCRGFYSLCLT